MWRPYPGVWAVVALLILAHQTLDREARGTDGAAGRRRRGLFRLGALLLWVALDWPLGALGGGYLVSLHMVQFLLVGLVVPPLLLAGLPPNAFARLAARKRWIRFVRLLTQPVAALVAFNAILALTHLPSVVDHLMVSQPGSFAIDALWFTGGLVLWWPIVCPVPERPRFHDLARMGYLFGNTIIMGAISLFLVFGDYPLYGVYELAPRVAGITARGDHQTAGVVMKVGGMVVHWSVITAIFFRWYRREHSPAPRAPAGRAVG